MHSHLSFTTNRFIVNLLETVWFTYFIWNTSMHGNVSEKWWVFLGTLHEFYKWNKPFHFIWHKKVDFFRERRNSRSIQQHFLLFKTESFPLITRYKVYILCISIADLMLFHRVKINWYTQWMRICKSNVIVERIKFTPWNCAKTGNHNALPCA